MSAAFHTVVETPTYLRFAEQAGISAGERSAIVDVIAADPRQGDEVVGSGGVRKVRMAGRGKGKSGGYRVMVAFLGKDVPVYLLAVPSKGSRANFDRSEIAAMREMTTTIKQARRRW